MWNARQKNSRGSRKKRTDQLCFASTTGLLSCPAAESRESHARRKLPSGSMNVLIWKISVALALLSAMATPSFAELFPSNGPTIGGSRALLRGTLACAPDDAPFAVKRAIWAANQLRSKPYRYGGGHKSFSDSGYDCSGTVSYALAAAGLMKVPLSSGEFRHYGHSGLGKWITV